ncbi:MAG TPA: SxtJ family membrane protein [Burkholderiales bacterium]|nr:SxtJ family membrane protein [Burkholderiales bacterium]
MAQTHEDLSRTEQVKGSSDRSFGWLFTAVFLIVALWPLVSGGAVRWWSLVVSAVLLVVTLAAPALLALPNRVWLRFGLLLNRILSPVVLAIMFYLVVTPMGWIMRASGKDSMGLRRDGKDSYWIKREPPGPKPDSLSNQF